MNSPPHHFPMTTDHVLNLAAFTRDSRVVGPGIRDALWVQGCSIRCAGCANAAYFEPDPRRLLRVSQLTRHFENRRESIDGVSVLGGEPTEQAEAVAALLGEVQALGLSTMVFTGRTYESLLKDPDPAIAQLLLRTDLLIDGPFVQNLVSPELRWRGSSNQRLLYLTPRLQATASDVPKISGEIVLDSDQVLLNGVGLVNYSSTYSGET